MWFLRKHQTERLLQLMNLKSKIRLVQVRVLYCTLIFFVLNSCSDDQKKHKHEILKSNFKIITDFDNFGLWGTFRKQNKQFYFFSDPNTSKKLSVFDENKYLVKSFNLEQLNKCSSQLVEISFINFDTIVALGSNNKLFFVNSLGNVFQSIDISKEVNSKFFLKVHSNFGRVNINLDQKTSLCYAITYDLTEDFYNLDNVDFEKKRSNLSNKLSHFIIIDDFFIAKLKTKLVVSNFYDKLIPQDHLNFGPPVYFVKGDSLIFTSMYSNKIFTYSISKNKLLNSKVIQSKLGKIGCAPLLIDKSIFDNQKIAKNLWYGLKIENIHYESRLKRYQLFVQKKVGEINPKWIQSTIFLDEDQNIIYEIQLNSKKYYNDVFLPFKKDKYLIYEIKRGNSKVKEFDIFSID